MLLITERDQVLEIEKRLPPSAVRNLHLTSGGNQTLDTKPSRFGTVIHFVYLGHDTRVADQFVSSLTGDTSNVFLVSPLSKWGFYVATFRGIPNLNISDQFDTRDSKIELAMSLTGLNKNKATIAMTMMKYNFSQLERNIDLLRWCAETYSDVETALVSVENYNYTDVLFYLCGSPYADRDKFIRTLSKYRYARKHMLKYMKTTLDHFINFRWNGVEPPKESSYVVTRLCAFLYLEDAIKLRAALDRVKDLSQLLRGESIT